MIRAYWNSLRVGDAVRVHDDSDPGLALAEGVVVSVDTRSGNNAVAIRTTDDDGLSTFVRPKRLAVHLRRGDDADCWRCGDSRRRAPRVERIDAQSAALPAS